MGSDRSPKRCRGKQARGGWQCLGDPENGLAYTDRFGYFGIRKDVYLLSWHEKVVPFLDTVEMQEGKISFSVQDCRKSLNAMIFRLYFYCVCDSHKWTDLTFPTVSIEIMTSTAGYPQAEQGLSLSAEGGLNTQANVAFLPLCRDISTSIYPLDLSPLV